MRIVLWVLFIFLAAGWWLISCTQKEKEIDAIHHDVSNSLEALANWYEVEWSPLLQKGSGEQLQQAFLKGRQLYKKEEWAIEYFFAATAKELNGPPVPEIEAAEHLLFPPSGFQMMETFLFPFKEKPAQ